MTVSRERGRVIISLQDDGAGIDIEQVRQKAIQLGFASETDSLSPENIYNLLFEEGFSMAEKVTQTSGRGIGLDIVRRATSQLQGTVRVTSAVGNGSTFTISVPVTLAITRALFIRSANQEFAVPLDQIAAVIRLHKNALDEIREQSVLRHEGEALATYNLSEFLVGAGATLEGQAYGLLVESGDQNTIILIDQLAGTNEAVVKSLGTHLRRVRGISGATISGDGRVVLILDLVELIGAELPKFEVADPILPGSQQPSPHSMHVLVVDDSLSVRHVVSNFLERSGMQTTTAKDGIDALEKLATVHPDIAIVDIEMPRMNGFELLSRIKSDPSTKDMPVLFLTSRSAAKHRERAKELNVDAYIVKPYREDELLSELTRLTRKRV